MNDMKELASGGHREAPYKQGGDTDLWFSTAAYGTKNVLD